MIHRMLQFTAGWEWHMLQPVLYDVQEPLPKRQPAAGMQPLAPSEEETAALEEQFLAIKRTLPECADWIDSCLEQFSNKITVTRTADSGALVHGTVVFQVSDDQEDLQPFHFWVSGNKLVTLQTDLRLSIRLQTSENELMLQACGTASEALLVVIGVILQPFQEGLDGFEQRLGELERSMRYRNRTRLIDTIFERRYELLHWSHLFIPIREIHSALKEAFMDELINTAMYKQVTAKLERIDTLLMHYTVEMDTLIAMDDAISTFRGNDIMKTLTIFTALFTPATVAGALWGVNFKLLPWSEQPWGFTVMTLIVILFTLVIYIWLWRKGWTGDLLYSRKNRIASPKKAKPGNSRDAAELHEQQTPVAADQPDGLPSRSSRR